ARLAHGMSHARSFLSFGEVGRPASAGPKTAAFLCLLWSHCPFRKHANELRPAVQPPARPLLLVRHSNSKRHRPEPAPRAAPPGALSVSVWIGCGPLLPQQLPAFSARWSSAFRRFGRLHTA